MELYLPPTIAKLHQGTEFREVSKVWQNRSKANRERMLKYWSDPKNRDRRVDHTQAKPLDVFDLEGHYLDTYPSARKAARFLNLPDENCVKAVRRGEKRQYRGYQFRDAAVVKHDIGPVPPIRYGMTKRKPYHKDNSYLCKPVRVTFHDGDTMDFDSLKDCAEALHRKQSTISSAIKYGRKCHGVHIQFIDNQQNKPIS